MTDVTVVPFSLNTRSNSRLTQQDKVDAWFWEQTALEHGYDRAVVQAHASVLGVEQDEFVLIYRLGHPWARWGAARQGRQVMVWRCSNGVEAGLYVCMKTALAGLPHASSAYASTGVPLAGCRVAQVSSLAAGRQ